MKTFENAKFKVVVNEDNTIVVTKKAFNERFYARLDENNKLIAKSSLALSMAMRARRELGF